MSNDNEHKEMAENLLEKAKIKIFLQQNNPKLLATAQVTLGGLIEINGFTIKKSQYDELWIQPPTYSPPKFYKSFFVKDKRIYKRLLEEIERAYKNELDEQGITESLEDIEF